MRLTSETLRRIIAEEVQNFKNQRRLSESRSNRSVRVTPSFINRIIKEELAIHNQRRLAESRRRRAKARRLAEARRRRARNSYYY